MGRSGTTLLTNMLNSNPHIIATPENEFLLFSFHSFFKKDFNNQITVNAFTDLFNYKFSKVVSVWKPSSSLTTDISILKKKTFENICKLVYLNYPIANKNKETTKFVVDKNPVYSLHLNILNRVYPKARYIVLTRDPRDNALSRKTYGNKKESVFLLAASWNYFYEKIFSGIKKHKLDHIVIRYEDLVSHPEDTLRKICSHLSIEFSHDMLNFQELSQKISDHAKQTLTTKTYEKISSMHSNLKKDVNTNRINAYEQGLNEKEIKVIEHFCKPYATLFNYTIANTNRINIIWKINYACSRLKLIVYYSLKALYYKLPVKLRRGKTT